jgi:hypothetical protein
MMWAFLFAVTGSTSVVTRYPGIQALWHRSGSRNALDIQENTQQTPKMCIVAVIT